MNQVLITELEKEISVLRRRLKILEDALGATRGQELPSPDSSSRTYLSMLKENTSLAEFYNALPSPTLSSILRKALDYLPNQFTVNDFERFVQTFPHPPGTPPFEKPTLYAAVSRMAKNGEILLIREGAGNQPNIYTRALNRA